MLPVKQREVRNLSMASKSPHFQPHGLVPTNNPHMDRLGPFRLFYSPLTLVVQVVPRDLGHPLSLEGLPDPVGKWDKGGREWLNTEHLQVKAQVPPSLLSHYQSQRSRGHQVSSANPSPLTRSPTGPGCPISPRGPV